MANRRLVWLAALVMALAAGGAGAALASGGSEETGGSPVPVAAGQDDGEADTVTESDAVEGPDVAITGPDLERASAAALDHLGEGRVTATEVGDEESYYEVEVTLDDGRQVDVQLDESFNYVGLD